MTCAHLVLRCCIPPFWNANVLPFSSTQPEHVRSLQGKEMVENVLVPTPVSLGPISFSSYSNSKDKIGCLVPVRTWKLPRRIRTTPARHQLSSGTSVLPILSFLVFFPLVKNQPYIAYNES
jgi:hypothetical protein